MKKPRHEEPDAYDTESEEVFTPSSDDEEDEYEKEYRRKAALKERERDERLKKKNDEKLKKLMKKRQKRDAHSDRKVLSYEDMPLDEREEKRQKEKRKSGGKRIVFAAVIILVLAGAVFLFANSDNLTFEGMKNYIEFGILKRDGEEAFPLSIQGENITDGNFQRMGTNLCYTSDTKFSVLNSYGKTLFSCQNGYSSPVLVTAHDYALVYNLGGTGFQINSLEETVYSATAENNIFLADIADNGTYALVTQSDGYLSKLYVYDSENTQIFAYSFADYYVTAVTLSASGREAVVAGLSALDGEEISALYVLDFTKEEPASFSELEGVVIYDAEYLNDATVCAVSSGAAFSLKTRSGEINEVPFDGKMLTGYFIDTDTDTFTVSLSRSGDGRNCDILTFSSSGALRNTISTDLRIVSVSTYKNRIAVLSGDTVSLFTKDGNLLSETAAGIDPHTVLIYAKNKAYILGTSEISTLEM